MLTTESFPDTASQFRPSDAAMSCPGIGSSARRNILLIENEALVVLDMTDDLVHWGFKVTGVADSREDVIRSIVENPPALAIVDVALDNGEDGITLAGILKVKFGIEVIFLTGHSDSETRARILSVNPLGYLFKPYSAVALRQMLDMYFRNEG